MIINRSFYDDKDETQNDLNLLSNHWGKELEQFIIDIETDKTLPWLMRSSFTYRLVQWLMTPDQLQKSFKFADNLSGNKNEIRIEYLKYCIKLINNNH